MQVLTSLIVQKLATLGEPCILRKNNTFCSPKSVLRYVSNFNSSGRNIFVLGDRRRKARIYTKVKCPESIAFVQEFVEKLADENQPRPFQLYPQYLEAIRAENEALSSDDRPLLHIFSLSNFYDRAGKLDKFALECARIGIDNARSKRASAGIGLPVLAPGERVEIDEWEVDLITLFILLNIWEHLDEATRKAIPKGRRWVVVAIDAATRCVLGFVITSAPSTDATKRLLYEVLVEKTDMARSVNCKSDYPMHCAPLLISTDTGPGFFGSTSIIAMSAVCKTLEFDPVPVSELRARVERFFGTLSTSYTSHLPGRTFSNPMVERARPPEATACLTDDELAELFMQWIVDYYHHRPHSGLGTQTPYNAWKEAVKIYGTPLTLGQEQICEVLGEERHGKLTNRGIEIHRLHYSCVELEDIYHGRDLRDFEFKFHQENIGFIMVRVDKKWVRADCTTPDFGGVRLCDWVEEYRTLAEKYANEAEIAAEYRDHAIRNMKNKVNELKRTGRLVPQRTLSPEHLAFLEANLFQGPRFVEVPALSFSSDPEIPFGEIIEPDWEEIDPTSVPPIETDDDPAEPTIEDIDDDGWEGKLED